MSPDASAAGDGDVVLALDQGTSSTKGIAVDRAGQVVARVTISIGQRAPRPGWVEQDAAEILASVVTGIGDLASSLPDGARVAAIGLSTQRESAVAWDAATGEPVGPMLGWQDRRTTTLCRDLIASGHADAVRRSTGLPIDPMFSAPKFAWILDEVDPDRARSAAGGIHLGTVDAWLVERLTGVQSIEAGNASRTGLMNLTTRTWDPQLLALYRIPAASLPEISASNRILPVVTLGGLAAPISGVLGDSHAALYGHGVASPGLSKVTLGTGSSIMGLVRAAGDPALDDGLVSTLAWADPEPRLAFEGNILSTGATLVWLAGLLGITVDGLVELAESDPESAVDLVPAFAGLGAPWWDARARALMVGFDLSTTRAGVARAALDSIALQIGDVLDRADTRTGRRQEILVDGGPSVNDRLVQRLADLTQRTVRRPQRAGVSAWGAALMAGRSAGVWDSGPGAHPPTDVFGPVMDADTASFRRDRWHEAVRLARHHSRSANRRRSTTDDNGPLT
ncbi:MAG: FGGY family carbohydrate kinase [Propionibacterium sp.]|nr:FGGY family carbohydrate kinase [Propionibacterium sp.]